MGTVLLVLSWYKLISIWFNLVHAGSGLVHFGLAWFRAWFSWFGHCPGLDDLVQSFGAWFKLDLVKYGLSSVYLAQMV